MTRHRLLGPYPGLYPAKPLALLWPPRPCEGPGSCSAMPHAPACALGCPAMAVAVPLCPCPCPAMPTLCPAMHRRGKCMAGQRQRLQRWHCLSCRWCRIGHLVGGHTVGSKSGAGGAKWRSCAWYMGMPTCPCVCKAQVSQCLLLPLQEASQTPFLLRHPHVVTLGPGKLVVPSLSADLSLQPQRFLKVSPKSRDIFLLVALGSRNRDRARALRMAKGYEGPRNVKIVRTTSVMSPQVGIVSPT